jgi:curved DNA-binding protein CbpA
MKPDQGLFQLDFDDHHAVLGIPMSADAKAVRKRYLTIARKLHPDSASGTSATEAQRASDILSKLVNPAYEALSQEKSSTEHMLVLKLKGQSLRRAGMAPTVVSPGARELLKAPHAEAAYRKAVNGLAERQFEQLEAVSDIIGELSELNLVYLYRSNSSDGVTAGPTVGQPQNRPAAAPAATATPTPRKNQAAILESYINRAQEYEQTKDYSRAILELRDAVKTYPNSGLCHSYLSALYFKAGQATMARIHAKRALEISPEDERALAVQNRVDKTSTSSGSAKAAAKAADKGGKGGFFGLFGGKKK